MKKFMTFLFLSLSLQVMAAPECDYHFNLSNATIAVNDINQVIQQSFIISRDQGAGGRCRDFRMFFGKGLANNYQRKAFSTTGDSLNYNLHQNINKNGILKDFNDALSSVEFLSGDMPSANTDYPNNLFVSVPSLASQNSPKAGYYTDNVQLAVYGYNPNSNNYSFESVSTFTITLIVAKKIDISVLDEGAPFNPSATSKIMDFGLLEMNAEQGADVRVVSNTPYQIKISSQNNGKLQLSSSTINYQLKSNGIPVSLATSGNTPVSLGSGSYTNSSGDLYNLKVKISEDVEEKDSGLYQDVITITTIAN